MPLVRKPPSGPPVAARSGADTASIARALASGTDEERWSAARAAADSPASVPAVEAALAREQSPAVREALFSALARLASPQAVEAVLPFLRSDDAQARANASDAVLAMKSAAWPYLPALLRDQDSDVRVLACNLVREMPQDEAVRLLCERVDAETEPNVCAAVVEVLAEIGGAEALPALTRCAARFGATPFLAFTIKIAIDRVRSQAPGPRA
jgi:HEAT repeat protein